MDYKEVSFRIEPFKEEYAEIVPAFLDDLGFESFTMEDPFVKGYIRASEFYDELIEAVAGRFSNIDAFSVEIDCRLIKGENWNSVWESNFPPLVIDEKCTVKASFHKGLPDTQYNIVIDPKMAFGTGHHQTTHLMASGLMKESVAERRVLDMGCGTGILAILSAKMGASEVVAIDNDPDASDSARENSAGNGVAERISVYLGDAGKIKEFEKFNTILANINRNIVINDMGSYAEALLPGGVLLLSGFYEEDVAMVIKAGEVCGLKFVHSESRERWAFVKMLLDV